MSGGKRFAADIMVGRLARWLRVLGLNARSVVLSGREVVESLISEGCIPVTRSRKFRDIDGVAFIRSDRSFEQLLEVISLVSITREEVRPFSRCTLCNARLVPVAREAVFGAVADYVFETAIDFCRCPDCARVYWPGSHRRKMIAKLESLTGWVGLGSEGEQCGAK
ncbi:MAG: Mut7-C RNAse domain-containing protein [Syntrophobacteraceae bacterium]|nr:Mut7-C RNAse domain-containing protein [Syntrophobacteraceae bacterium]